jgi:hypothetical protein
MRSRHPSTRRNPRPRNALEDGLDPYKECVGGDITAEDVTVAVEAITPKTTDAPEQNAPEATRKPLPSNGLDEPRKPRRWSPPPDARYPKDLYAPGKPRTTVKNAAEYQEAHEAGYRRLQEFKGKEREQAYGA